MSALPQFFDLRFARGELVVAISEALRMVPRSTCAALAVYLGHEEPKVRAALRRMEQAGLVEVCGRSGGLLCYGLVADDPQRAARRADAAAKELGAMLALLDRHGAPTATFDGRLLAPVERLDLLLTRGWACGQAGDKSR